MDKFIYGVIFVITIYPLLEHITSLLITGIEYVRSKIHQSIIRNETTDSYSKTEIGFKDKGDNEVE